MPIPVWIPGQILTSNDVNSWLAPNAVVKQADQSVANSVVPVNDTELVLPVLANAQYIFTCFLDYEGGTSNASDLRWQWSVPSAATLRYSASYQQPAGTVIVQLTYPAATVNFGITNGAANLRSVTMLGTLLVGANAGNLQLQWAQSTSSATATTIHAQSSLSLQRTS